MKNVIIVGIIAGFVSGVVMFIFHISGLFELFSVLPTAYYPVDVQTLAIYNIIYGVISGIIWTVFYAFFYDYVPSKGVKKGLVYSFIIWIIAPIHLAGVAVMYGGHMWAPPYTISTFFSIVIVYGLLIGILYKKE